MSSPATLEELTRRVEALERALAAGRGVQLPARDWQSAIGISQESEFSQIWLAEMAAAREAERAAILAEEGT
jgi:hypothetical protein